MNIKNTYRGVLAYLKLPKAQKQAFRKLPGYEQKNFFRLDRESREQFLLFVEILTQNDPSRVIETVKKLARHSGAPSVEYFEHLTLEAKRQTNYAKQKINNITADPNIKTKEQTDIVAITNPREMKDQLNLLNEQIRMEKNHKIKSRKR